MSVLVKVRSLKWMHIQVRRRSCFLGENGSIPTMPLKKNTRHFLPKLRAGSMFLQGGGVSRSFSGYYIYIYYLIHELLKVMMVRTPLPRSRSITNVLRYVNVPYYTCNWKQKRENRLIHTQLSSIDILSILVIGHFNEDKRLFCYYRSRFYYTNKKCSYTLRNPTVSFRNENFRGVILIR